MAFGLSLPNLSYYFFFSGGTGNAVGNQVTFVESADFVINGALHRPITLNLIESADFLIKGCTQTSVYPNFVESADFFVNSQLGGPQALYINFNVGLDFTPQIVRIYPNRVSMSESADFNFIGGKLFSSSPTFIESADFSVRYGSTTSLIFNLGSSTDFFINYGVSTFTTTAIKPTFIGSADLQINGALISNAQVTFDVQGNFEIDIPTDDPIPIYGATIRITLKSYSRILR